VGSGGYRSSFLRNGFHVPNIQGKRKELGIRREREEMKKGKQLLAFYGLLAVMLSGMNGFKSFFNQLHKIGGRRTEPKPYDRYAKILIDRAKAKRNRRRIRNMKWVASGGMKARCA
jgi:hypothetical protein